jgi:hypothetical protein
MNKTHSASTILMLALGTLFACDRAPNAPRDTGASISVFNNAASIDPMAGRRVIDFEDQPVDGSIANPLVLEGASFTDPVDLRTGFCSSPTCQPDPDNALGGNTSLFLNPAGTIDFPARTIIAALTIEGIGANPFQLKVTDSAGNTKSVDGAGVEFGVATVGFKSSSGISRVEILSVGGTGGPLAISAVSFVRSPAP